MKNFVAALAFIGASSFAIAQESGTNLAETPAKYQFYVGPYAALKLGVNPSVYNPTNGRIPAGVGVSADFGVSSYFPINQSRTFGVALDLGYMTYNYKHNPAEDFVAQAVTGQEPSEANEFEETYSYINFSPYLNIWGFTAGFNIGFPASAETENGQDSVINPLHQYSTGEDIKDRPEAYSPNPDVTKFLKTVVELRLGGMINVFENQMGRLNINLQAGYVLSGLYTEPSDYRWGREYTFDTQSRQSVPKDRSGKGDDNLNPKPISFSIGLSYLFTLPPM